MQDAPQAKPQSFIQRHPLTAVLLLLGLFYLGNYNGIWTSNDGSHFALVKAIVERGTFELGTTHLRYTLGVDFALNPELEIYSDRPPGTALVLVPFYGVGMLATRLMDTDRFDMENTLRFFATTGILFFALLNVALVYWAGRLLKASKIESALGALIFGATGLTFKYSMLMFSHTPGVTTTLLGACFILAPLPELPAKRNLFLFSAGLAMGYAVVIEYQNVIFSAVFFIAWLIRLTREGHLPRIMYVIAGGAIPAIGLATYHKLIFGSILISTHAFNPMMTHNQKLGAIFGGSFLKGLYDIFVARDKGVIALVPIFLFGSLGLWLARSKNRTAVVPLFAVVIYTLIIARHTTITGGATNDCRYYFPATSLLALGIAPFLSAIQHFNGPLRHIVKISFLLIAIYSFAASFYTTIDQKIELTRPVPVWKAIVIKYATLTDPDHNIERLVRNYVLPIYGTLDADWIFIPQTTEPATQPMEMPRGIKSNGGI